MDTSRFTAFVKGRGDRDSHFLHINEPRISIHTFSKESLFTRELGHVNLNSRFLNNEARILVHVPFKETCESRFTRVLGCDAGILILAF